MDFEVLCRVGGALDSLAVLEEKPLAELTGEERGVIAELAGRVHQILNANEEDREQWDEITGELLELLSASGEFPNVNPAGAEADEIIRTWLGNFRYKTAVLLLPQLLKQEEMEPSTARELLSLFTKAPVEDREKATALYLLANRLEREEPSLSYESYLLAFESYPQLGRELGFDYVYDETGLREQYADACPICRERSSTPFYCVRQIEAIGGDSGFSPAKLWLKCNRCSNLYAYNFPVSRMGDINGHYTKCGEDAVISPRMQLRIYSDILNKCRIYTEGRRYLEIGIGTGEMAAVALELQYEVEAVEICRQDAETVAGVLGIPVAQGDFLEFEAGHLYDVIVMGDVLEHISRPVQALQKAVGLLDEGGVLFLSTPNYNSGFTRMMKFRDPMWNQKNHFTYFSYETLLPILEEVGLSVERYDVSNRYRGSMELYCVKKEF